MGVIDLLQMNANAPGAPTSGRIGQSRPDLYFSLDGIQFIYPPETVTFNGKYRLNVKQVAAGLTADKAGPGGVEIVIASYCPFVESQWLHQIRELLLTRSSDAEFMVFYDPIDQLTYEVLAQEDSFRYDISKANGYNYSINLKGQLLGTSWLTQSLVDVGVSETVAAFDIKTLGIALADAQAQAEYWDALLKANKDTASTGQGAQAPSKP